MRTSSVVALLCLLGQMMVLLVSGSRKPESIDAVQPDSPANFRGGHAENVKVDRDACEFKKTHGEDHPERFDAEFDFLLNANSSSTWAPLVPHLHRLEVESNTGRRFMVLQDVLCKLKRPVIADFKLGLQSWTPDFAGIVHAGPEKKAKMDKLDAATTTKTLGVRATSIQLPPSPDTWDGEGSIPQHAVYLPAGRTAEKQGLLEEPGSEWRRGSSREDFERLLGTYLPTPQLRKAFVDALRKFIEVFKVQTIYRFTGASLFVFYDGEHAQMAPKLGMVMIDFPHTLGAANQPFGRIDEGVLTGLYSLDVIARKIGLA